MLQVDFLHLIFYQDGLDECLLLMDTIHKQWGTHRHVITTPEDSIHLDPFNDNIWTTHCDDSTCENYGFNLPIDAMTPKFEIIDTPPPEEITIKGRKYPVCSLLIKENANRRPTGWVLPEGEEEVSLVNKE